MRFSISNAILFGALSIVGTAQAQPPIAQEIFYLLETIPTLIPTLSEYETPMTARFTSLYDATWWNCVAVFSSDYKDSLTKIRPTVVSPDPASHTTPTRAACVTQATASLNDLFFGGINAYAEAMKKFEELTIEYEVPANVKECMVDEATLFTRNLRKLKESSDSARTSFVADASCLEDVASEASYSPNTMGHIVAMQTYVYAVMDGYNMLGTEGGCETYCRPYADTTGYEPSTRAGSWRPLLEDNGKGFFFYQQFVTPHIGQKAKFRFLPEAERATRVIRKPDYSMARVAEADAVISEMALLDDKSKLQIEAFDDKLYVTTQVINAFVGKLLQVGYKDEALGADGVILSLERLLHFNQGLTGAEYDSIVIAWKEKVKYDLVRPTTIIKERGDEKITTWTMGGVKTFPARDFEAYKRVMPHAEYTSGSSCLFEALKDYVETYLTTLGIDPTDFPITFPPVQPGESKVEPGITPSSEVTLQYGSLAEMADAGCQSRFHGGMHFYDSVPAGIELCSGIGVIVSDGTFNLIEESVTVKKRVREGEKKEVGVGVGGKFGKGE